MASPCLVRSRPSPSARLAGSWTPVPLGHLSARQVTQRTHRLAGYRQASGLIAVFIQPPLATIAINPLPPGDAPIGEPRLVRFLESSTTHRRRPVATSPQQTRAKLRPARENRCRGTRASAGRGLYIIDGFGVVDPNDGQQSCRCRCGRSPARSCGPVPRRSGALPLCCVVEVPNG